MNALFEVWDTHPSNRAVFVDLATILDALPPEAAQLPWQLIELEMVGQRSTSRDLLALAALTQRGSGVRVSFDALQRMTDDTVQIVNGIFLAPVDEDAPPPVDGSNDDLLEESVAMLAAVNGEFWTLWVPPAWTPSLKAAFTDLRSVDPPDARLGP
jgi:hypothetical protein